MSLPVTTPARAVSGSAQLLDIRESYEAVLAPVPTAIRIPLGALLARPDDVPRDRPLLIVDHDGSRVAFATRYLREHGFDAVGVPGGALAIVEPGPR